MLLFAGCERELYLPEKSPLEELICTHNHIRNLELNKNDQIKKLFIDNNELTEIDLSNCTEILNLDCHHNHHHVCRCCDSSTSLPEAEAPHGCEAPPVLVDGCLVHFVEGETSTSTASTSDCDSDEASGLDQDLPSDLCLAPAPLRPQCLQSRAFCDPEQRADSRDS